MKKSRNIYMDVASSARADSANPGAIHALGVAEKMKLEKGRIVISGILGVQNDEIIFTSGATESNNLAILGMPAGHIVTTNIEHASVLETCKHRGNVTFVAVEPNGIVDPKKIKKALRPNTVLVSVMYANNEIGTVQPIREIAKEIRHYRKQATKQKRFLRSSDLRVPIPARPFENLSVFPLFHTDATQAINYLPIQVPQLGVDMMSFNSAKIYGPKGVGVLYVKSGTPLRPIMFGGDQEGGLRPGTENVALAESIANALSETEKIKNKEIVRLNTLRDYFIYSLIRANKRILVNGDLQNRLPNNINITIPNIPSDLLVIELSARGIMASAKSACKAGDGKDSYVIEALRKADGLPAKALVSAGSLRFSLGRETTKKDIDDTVKALSEILKKLKKWYY